MLFFSYSSYSQEEIIIENKINSTFFQFDLSFPLKANTNKNDPNYKNNSWFLPDGLSAKFGYGLQHKKWIGLSLHSGIDWKGNEKMVVIPVYGNLRISPGFGNGSRITLQAGFGKGFALGRGNLSGNYQKYSIGFETEDDLILFAELSNYDIKIGNFNQVGSFSLGIALRTF